LPMKIYLLGILMSSLFVASSTPVFAQMSAEERKKLRAKEVVGHLKGERPADAKMKICVYDVFGKERTVRQDRSLRCPPQVRFPP
ncbi:MAG: hypothetical protein ACO3P5_02675, partial [Steroidobacteraceae bacterium]